MEASAQYSHFSPRAAAAMQAGSRVFTLALPRSEKKPWITAASEGQAQVAAAKLCQRNGVRLLDVWFEDGMHDDWGMYRRWYIIVSGKGLH